MEINLNTTITLGQLGQVLSEIKNEIPDRLNNPQAQQMTALTADLIFIYAVKRVAGMAKADSLAKELLEQYELEQMKPKTTH